MGGGGRRRMLVLPFQQHENWHKLKETSNKTRAVARTLIGGGGVYSYIQKIVSSARLTSFEINFISKETSRAQLEYMNIQHPPINALATALNNEKS